MSRRAEIFGALMALHVGAMGCDDASKTAVRDAGTADARPNEAVMDKNIVNAVQSARAQSSGTAAVVDGPPANGVFEPGKADLAHLPGAPIKVTLYEKGSEPRVLVRPKLDLDKPQIITVTVTNRMGQQVRPNVDYTLSVAVKSPKAKEGEEGKPAEAAADAGPAGPVERTVSFTLKKVVPSRQQPGQLPPSLEKAIAQLEGSRITAKLAVDGSIRDEQVKLADKADPALGELISPLIEVLGLFFSPWPAEPVGEGGYWIATDRTTASGMGVVRYRIIKVEKLEGNQAAFSLDLRLWAAGSGSVPLGTPPAFKTLSFNAVGKAAWVRNVGELLPIAGQITAPISVQLGNPEQPQQVVPVQLETGGEIRPTAPPAGKGD